MTEEQYEELKILKEEISKKEQRMRTIGKLLNSCGLHLTIKGTPRQCRMETELLILDKEIAKELISLDQKKTEAELTELQAAFEKIKLK